MKSLILLFSLSISLACDTPNNVLETSSSDSLEETSDNSGQEQQSVSPNTITLMVKILEIHESIDICGISKSNVIGTEVMKVVQSGSSIVNKPNVKDKMLLDFILFPKDLNKNTTIEVKATESLCQDGSKTYFTIASHKILK
ncbi:hypothetical protein MTsPCn9_17100 [Croceitalea sp. MTPC9]|uniref:hypothetical protein n=1 Tax=unclassified Croceitalea TaxID=2632280 RepID=UPI002B3E6023|nr:hypothetical protein MTsPCn6_09950 [Croceitalea sp. MTPC6]GMN16774.1 hypothetical protein MTsPCn9_17100 [Croceitalea sp. MTPC9]